MSRIEEGELPIGAHPVQGDAETAGNGLYDSRLLDRVALEEEVAAEHAGPADGGEVTGRGSISRQMLRVFMQNKMAVISVGYIVVLVLLCIIVPQFYGRSYWGDAGSNLYGHDTCFTNSVPGGYGSAGPTWTHPFGCTTGYDNFALLFYAGRFSLFIGLLAGVVTMVVGTAYGIIAGYRGGMIDSVLMRLNDVFLSIPGLYLLLLVITLYGSSVWSLIAVIGLTSWFGVARLMRSEAQLLRDREYSQAARSMGATGRRVMWKHVLPNSMSTMLTAATFSIGDSVIALSTLGFLGVALQIPDWDWGTIINNATHSFSLGYWWTLVPVALAFILFVLSTNYIGDALRDAFEVRLQER
jgi:peptide/nickel transport system permease protein